MILCENNYRKMIKEATKQEMYYLRYIYFHQISPQKVFGLTDKQVQEIERNDGLTNADLEA